MEPTVLAGPIEFSPAEIAAIIAVLAGLFVVLTAPGWALVAYAAHRRRAARGPGRTWPATVGGAVGGLLLSAGVAALVGALVQSVGGIGFLFVVLAAWAACAVLAWALMRAKPPRATPGHRPPPPGAWRAPEGDSGSSREGWGR
jgi:hypothetical protein